MTAYQVLHRTAKAKRGETVLVHGAAGRVGVAALELGAVAGLRLFGTASARDRAKVEALGAVAIDYRNEDFLARVREEAGGVDVVVDSLGGPISLRSFRALRPGGRLVVFGRYDTLKDGHKDWPAVIKWYAAIAAVWLWDKLSPRRRVFAYHVQKYRDRATRRAGAVGGEPMDPEQFREDFGVLIELLREGKIHPVVAERLPLSRRAPRARAARELGVQGQARARPMKPRGHRADRWRRLDRAGQDAPAGAHWRPTVRQGLRGSCTTRWPANTLPARGTVDGGGSDRPVLVARSHPLRSAGRPARRRTDRTRASSARFDVSPGRIEPGQQTHGPDVRGRRRRRGTRVAVALTEAAMCPRLEPATSRSTRRARLGLSRYTVGGGDGKPIRFQPSMHRPLLTIRQVVMFEVSWTATASPSAPIASTSRSRRATPR